MKKIVVFVVIIIIIIGFLLINSENKGNYNMVDENLQFKETNNGYTWIYFYSNTCSACASFSPVLDEFSSSNDILINKVETNTENQSIQNTIEEHKIEATPTIIIEDKDNIEIKRITGTQSLSELDEYIELA